MTGTRGNLVLIAMVADCVTRLIKGFLLARSVCSTSCDHPYQAILVDITNSCLVRESFNWESIMTTVVVLHSSSCVQ